MSKKNGLSIRTPLGYSLVTAILFFLSVLFCLAIYIFGRGVIAVCNIASCMVYVIFVYVTLRCFDRFVLFNLFFIFNFLWFLFSLLLLEFGAYTPELEIFGEPTGATSRYVLISILFIASSILAFNTLKISDKALSLSERKAFVICSVYLLLVSLIYTIYAFYGCALTLHVDRIYFRNEIAPNGYMQIMTALVLLSYPLGLIRIQYAKHRIKIDVLFVAFVISLILGGEKFSLVFISIFLYYLAHQSAVNLFTRKNLVYFSFFFLFAGFIVVGLSINQYGNIENKSGNKAEPFHLLYDRVAQQSQLNYFFDKLIFVDNYKDERGVNFERELFRHSEGDKKGINLLMSIATPQDIYESYEASGVTFGDGFPAILYYYFSGYSFIVIIFFGLFFGFTSGLCVRSLYRGYIVENFLLMFLLYNTLLSIFLNGNVYMIFELSLSKILCVIFVFCIYFYRFLIKGSGFSLVRF